ncbi:DUF1194 domain-containing protein [Actibacterium ureilyticum]|uniref:DUF1194 domain-containing protein n=1 Tax=Actibacterium ureilyticum TaxID=1590614 RepID=UPI001FE2A245|nr:DUF1194 domain-containing protein [Actibacterium ureilyticum]
MVGRAPCPGAKALAVCLAALCPTAAPGQTACRQALAIGLDVSGSVDRVEYRLQLGGLANALMHPDVRKALLAMPSAPVRLLIFEWSGAEDQHVLLPWTEITTDADLAAINAILQRSTRLATAHTTAIGSAIEMGAAQLSAQGACWKRTLDLTGDGKSNAGPRPRAAQLGPGSDITVNALVIGTVADPLTGDRAGELADLVAYFQAEVIRGPDAFTETATQFRDFEQAMVRKLLKELQGLSVSRNTAEKAPG